MVSFHDLTRPADLSQHDKGTGAIRSQHPVYVSLLPPCNHACPAGENIQAWLSHFQAGNFYQAFQTLIEENPLPAVHGRVCYHPCESACNRTHIDTSVSIHAVERFLGDKALEENWQVDFHTEKTNKKILIVGAGPSGLSAAYHLTRLGHKVEIYEAGPLPGGMLHFGIPAYRLPRDILDKEIKRIENMGIKIILNHKVEDILAIKEQGQFDAVFIAIGAHIGKKVDIPARDAGKILDAVSFLENVESGETPKLGRRVAIYGGGNTAMDAARTAKRLGAEEALIIYRRDRDHMPAHDFEVSEAIEEGIKIHWLRTIKEIDQDQIVVEVMELGEDGKPQPTGRFENLAADALILALGQKTDISLLEKIPHIRFKEDGTVVVNQQMMTHYPGIFAGGDMVPSARTVTTAVGHGKQAARYMDLWLKNLTDSEQAQKQVPIVGYERLHVWYSTEAPQQIQPALEAYYRNQGFNEIIGNLTQAEAHYEAKRCLSCGNCFECDGCYGACPEKAVIKLGPGKKYEFDYSLCTGCAVCYEQCPCHAIEMYVEEI